MDQEQNTKPEEGFPAAPVNQKSDLSMFVGVGAFIVILVALGWYTFSGMSQGVTESDATPVVAKEMTPTTTEDAAAAALSTQSSSDDVGSISADLSATDLNSVGEIDKI